MSQIRAYAATKAKAGEFWNDMGDGVSRGGESGSAPQRCQAPRACPSGCPAAAGQAICLRPSPLRSGSFHSNPAAATLFLRRLRQREGDDASTSGAA
jgi:hypothetical protein